LRRNPGSFHACWFARLVPILRVPDGVDPNPSM